MRKHLSKICIPMPTISIKLKNSNRNPILEELNNHTIEMDIQIKLWKNFLEFYEWRSKKWKFVQSEKSLYLNKFKLQGLLIEKGKWLMWFQKAFLAKCDWAQD